MTTHSYEFPQTTICTVDQAGFNKSPRRRGVGITLHVKDGVPSQAEVFDLATGGDEEYALIGLEIENRTLMGYDGVFDFPEDLMKVLEQYHGIKNGLE